MAAETTEAVDSSMTVAAAGGATAAVAPTTVGATATTLPAAGGSTDTTVAATGGLTGLTDEQGGHGCINN